jgi:hypothetical protein
VVYWVVNLSDARVEAYKSPWASEWEAAYLRREEFFAGQAVPPVLGDVNLFIPVDEILP